VKRIADLSRFDAGVRKPSAAFSLVEVTLALGVAGFCLLAILGLLQTGLTSEKVTTGQTAATGILSAVFSDLISTPSTATNSPIFQIALDNQSPASPQTVYFSEAGKPTDIGQPPAPESRYRVSVGVGSNNSGPTPVRILVTWPAAADPLPTQWPTKAAGAVEVVTALNRE